MNKRIKTFEIVSLISILPVLLPILAHGQLAEAADADPLQEFLRSILIFINDFLIPFILGIGFLMFVWWVFRYFIVGGADEEKVQKGKSYIVYATLGFLIIILFFGIVNMIAESIGLEGQRLHNIPNILSLIR